MIDPSMTGEEDKEDEEVEKGRGRHRGSVVLLVSRIHAAGYQTDEEEDVSMGRVCGYERDTALARYASDAEDPGGAGEDTKKKDEKLEPDP